jgi:hypothetical protein
MDKVQTRIILSVVHNRQNPLDSIRNLVFQQQCVNIYWKHITAIVHTVMHHVQKTIPFKYSHFHSVFQFFLITLPLLYKVREHQILF